MSSHGVADAKYSSGHFSNNKNTDHIKNWNNRSNVKETFASNEFESQNPRKFDPSQVVTDFKESNVAETFEYRSSKTYVSSQSISSTRTVSKTDTLFSSSNNNSVLKDQPFDNTYDHYSDNKVNEKKELISDFYSINSSDTVSNDATTVNSISKQRLASNLESSSMNENLIGAAKSSGTIYDHYGDEKLKVRKEMISDLYSTNSAKTGFVTTTSINSISNQRLASNLESKSMSENVNKAAMSSDSIYDHYGDEKLKARKEMISDFYSTNSANTGFDNTTSINSISNQRLASNLDSSSMNENINRAAKSSGTIYDRYEDEKLKERKEMISDLYSTNSTKTGFDNTSINSIATNRHLNSIKSTSVNENTTGNSKMSRNVIHNMQDNNYVSENSTFKKETIQSSSYNYHASMNGSETMKGKNTDLQFNSNFNEEKYYSDSYENKEYIRSSQRSLVTTNHVNHVRTAEVSVLKENDDTYSRDSLIERSSFKDSSGGISRENNLANESEPAYRGSLTRDNNSSLDDIQHIKSDGFVCGSFKNDLLDSSSRSSFPSYNFTNSVSKEDTGSHSTQRKRTDISTHDMDTMFNQSNQSYNEINDQQRRIKAFTTDKNYDSHTNTGYEYQKTYVEKTSKEYHQKHTDRYNPYDVAEAEKYKSNINRSSLLDKSYETHSSMSTSYSSHYSNVTESSRVYSEKTNTRSVVDGPRSVVDGPRWETRHAPTSSINSISSSIQQSTQKYSSQVEREDEHGEPSSTDHQEKMRYETTSATRRSVRHNQFTDTVLETNSYYDNAKETKKFYQPQETFGNASSLYQHYGSVDVASVKKYSDLISNPTFANAYPTTRPKDKKITMTISGYGPAKKSFKVPTDDSVNHNKKAVVKFSNRKAKVKYNETTSDTKSNQRATINIKPSDDNKERPVYKISAKNRFSPLSSPKLRRKLPRTYCNAKPTTTIKIPSTRNIANYEPNYPIRATRKLPKTIIRIRGGNTAPSNIGKRRVRLTFAKSKPKVTIRNSAPKPKMLRVHIPLSDSKQQSLMKRQNRNIVNEQRGQLSSKRRYHIGKSQKNLDNTSRKLPKIIVKISNRDSAGTIINARSKKDRYTIDYPSRKTQFRISNKSIQKRWTDNPNKNPKYIVKISAPPERKTQNHTPNVNCYKSHSQRQRCNFKPITLLLSALNTTSDRQPSSGKDSYTVETHTGDCYWAGTNANVFIRLYGENGNSGDIYLEESLSNKKPFVRGNVDKFKVKSKLLGKITKIAIFHDNTGEFPELQLKKVVITDERDGFAYEFPYNNKWIEGGENEREEDEDRSEENVEEAKEEEVNAETAVDEEVEEEEEDKEDKEDSEEDEPFKVIGMDPLISLNGKSHYTRKFKTEKPSLIIRRGQIFKLSVKVAGEKQRDDALYLILKSGNSPDEADGTLIAAPQVSTDAFPSLQSDNKWGFTICDAEDQEDIVIAVNIPSNALPARYNLVIFKNDESIYEADFPIYILFNPWCKDDDVFMDDEKKLREYILKQSGQVYVGNWKRPRSRNWYYGQFEAISLETAFALLERARAGDRDTAVKVSRVISSLVNSCDNNGVLIGNWSGEYDDGKSPTFWTSTPAILEAFMPGQQPVKYGQCWVFSSIVTTIMRTLGIPCRSVTNFKSAHDSEGNCSNDIYLNKEGERIREKRTDSVWNFHVWNDVWMSRPDLPPGYGGWQAIDSTPQETSGGLYQMGPASLRAVKEGNIQLGYDTAFVLAEVNADTIYWQQGYDGEFQAVKRNTSSVGRKISTKEVGSYHREDITEFYKFAEGSILERSAVKNALLKAGNRAVNKTKKDIEISLVPYKEQYYVGDDVALSIKLINTSKKELPISVGMSSQITRYDGVEKAKLAKYKSTINLKGNGTKNIPIKIKARTYLSHVEDDTMLRFVVFANVASTGQVEVADEVIDLAKPDLDLIDMPKRFKAGEKETFIVSFINPIEKPLTQCELYIDGSIIKDRLYLPNADIPAKEIFKRRVQITPDSVEKDSKKSISVSFCSKELGGIQSVRKVQVVR